MKQESVIVDEIMRAGKRLVEPDKHILVLSEVAARNIFFSDLHENSSAVDAKFFALILKAARCHSFFSCAGFKTYIDLKCGYEERLFLFTFMPKDEFVAEYFIDLV